MASDKIRKAASLPSAASRNKASVRFDTASSSLVVSNGTNWVPTDRILVTYRQQPNGELADECFFIAPRACKVVAVKEMHTIAGTDGSAVNIQVTKDTGTNAPGAGTNLLTNSTNAGFSLKGTANTVQSGVLSATAADLALAAGNRLSVDFAGVLTTVEGVVLTVELQLI